MKSKSLIAFAVAGALSCASAFAGSGHHRVEVQTPSSVSESAPWLAGKSHLKGWTASPASSTAVGMSQDLSGESMTLGSSGLSATSDEALPFYVVEITEYWLIGADEPTGSSAAIGSTSSVGGSGSGGFDSSLNGGSSGDLSYHTFSDTSFEQSSFDASGSSEIVVYTPAAESIYESMGDQTPLLSEHYLVTGPLSSFDGSSVLVLAIGPTSEDIALLDSLKQDFFVLTPSYDES